MANLDIAIARVKAEIDAYAPGSSTAPKEGTPDWFVLRSLVIGYTYLVRLSTLQMQDDPASCERLYRRAAQHFAALDLPTDSPPQ